MAYSRPSISDGNYLACSDQNVWTKCTNMHAHTIDAKWKKFFLWKIWFWALKTIMVDVSFSIELGSRTVNKQRRLYNGGTHTHVHSVLDFPPELLHVIVPSYWKQFKWILYFFLCIYLQSIRVIIQFIYTNRAHAITVQRYLMALLSLLPLPPSTMAMMMAGHASNQPSLSSSVCVWTKHEAAHTLYHIASHRIQSISLQPHCLPTRLLLMPDECAQ